MKRITIIATALCLSLMTTGCVANKKAPAVTTEAATAGTTAETTASHNVEVELIKLFSHVEGDFEIATVVPKITVDGKEATEINAALSEHIKKEYKLEMDGVNADGMSTRIAWGAKDNTLSIIILANDTSTDYFTAEVFNYDLDTLKDLDDSEVTKRLGMTDDEFFSKTTEIIKKHCEGSGYDLKKSLEAVKYEKITPFIMPDGNPGVLGCICYGEDSQFSGLESMRCFNMKTMERASFS